MKRANFGDKFKDKMEAKNKIRKEEFEEGGKKDLTLKQCWITGLVVAIIVTSFVTMLSSFGVGILIGIPVGIAVACGMSGIKVKTE